MKRAVIYARYSSDAQSEQSIDGQMRVCNEYAKSHDISILDVYIDRAMTGTNDNRPSFQKMIKDSENKMWDYVLVYKLDRFSRNKYEMAVHKKTLKDNGVKVFSATEYIPDTPEAIIFESMLEGYAEFYSAELSQKVKRGMKETRRKGNYQGGPIPFGYVVKEKKFYIDEEKAKIVRFIFEQYSLGIGVNTILKMLDNQSIMYNGKPFIKNTIYKMLKNERYSGVYKFKDEVIDNMYPQIVSKEVFDKVREKTIKNKLGKNSVTVEYLLRSKVKCGYCGSSIAAECGRSKTGNILRYYKCTGRKKKKSNCKKMSVRKEFLEEFVIDIIVKELSKPQVMDMLVKGILRVQENQDTNSELIKNLMLEKARVEKSLDNLVSAIERGVVSKITSKRLKELEERQEQLEMQIMLEKNKEIVKINENDIRKHYEKALKLEPTKLINMLIKNIVLYDDKIEINYITPINNSPDESQGFCFYQFTSYLKFKDKNN